MQEIGTLVLATYELLSEDEKLETKFLLNHKEAFLKDETKTGNYEEIMVDRSLHGPLLANCERRRPCKVVVRYITATDIVTTLELSFLN